MPRKNKLYSGINEKKKWRKAVKGREKISSLWTICRFMRERVGMDSSLPLLHMSTITTYAIKHEVAHHSMVCFSSSFLFFNQCRVLINATKIPFKNKRWQRNNNNEKTRGMTYVLLVSFQIFSAASPSRFGSHKVHVLHQDIPWELRYINNNYLFRIKIELLLWNCFTLKDMETYHIKSGR